MPDGLVDPTPTCGRACCETSWARGRGTGCATQRASSSRCARASSWGELPLEPTGTLDGLRRIHRWLFRDACDWAGEVGTVEIRKAGEGAQFLLPSVNIPMGIAWARSELGKDDSLAGVAPRRFPGRMAYHYDNYCFVHPFREGNGRALCWVFTGWSCAIPRSRTSSFRPVSSRDGVATCNQYSVLQDRRR